MKILGISAFYHDSAACLVIDGEIVSAAQEERFTRKKHDFSFPKNAIKYCLENYLSGPLSISDIDYVAFYDKPFLKMERIIETYLSFAPSGIKSFFKSMPLWIKQKIWMKEYISKELEFNGKIIFPEHHESHAASAFYPSPFKEAAFITMDGVGEWTTGSYGTGEQNRIEILEEMVFPHSLGLLYSAFTYHLGFKVNSGEYKVMGLAPYGKPKYKDTILTELVDLKEDGSFRLNMDYFDYCVGLKMTNAKFDKLFGPVRKSETKLTQEHMDIASSIQEVTDEIMTRISGYVFKQTGKKKLCLAGGVALNCVSNSKILKSCLFEDIWIQPASGDAGGALGAALCVWYMYLDNKRITDEKKDSQKSSYLGPEYSEKNILEFLENNKVNYTKLNENELLEKTTGLINEQKVIGWFQGRMEFGPRALGNRSIIGDARSPEMQETMNLKTKFRESFRPFAPSVLKEKVSEYFEIEKQSPYMLLVADLRKDKRRELNSEEQSRDGINKLHVVRSVIPAVTHVDYSARLQTVSYDDNPLFYKLIKKFNDKYGCPVIINTSFNVRGEPIVCNPQDAYLCFMRTNMDYLILGNFIIEKNEQKPLDKDINWLREFELD